MQLSNDERAIRQRLKNDFPHYAQKCLRIRPKKGAIEPFVLNSSQLKLHRIAEKQRREKGFVRLIVLKGRQLGISTYVQGRWYWRTSHSFGVKAFVLTHEQAATDALFSMAKRFHENCPALVRPSTKAANAKELSFDKLDSGYSVGTAGTVGVGRSQTIQLFHGSEVAFWANADTHVDGVMNAVPRAEGTESILESTANGVGGLFYSMAMSAMRGEGDYELVFLPWFEHEEYEAAPHEGFIFPEEWQAYGQLHKIGPDKLYWAYLKNAEQCQAISGDPDTICWKFKQEYPATVEEAFQTSGVASFVPSRDVLNARNADVRVSGHTPLILGVDPARGGDKTHIIDRQGRLAGSYVHASLDEDDLMALCGRIVSIMQGVNPDKVFVDITGLGAGLYDRLRELGYGGLVHGINFAQKASDPTRYANKRAEMWDTMRDWFTDPAGVSVPNDDQLHIELTAPVWDKGATRHTSNGALLIEDKQHIKDRIGHSPDMADALALTFAYPVGAALEHSHTITATGHSAVTGY